MIRSILASAVLASGTFASASIAPMKITPLGKPDAPVSGTFNRNLGAEPESLNPININEQITMNVAEFVVEGLLYLNADTNEFQPQLAESYEISKDALTYTFNLRKDAKFSDGQFLRLLLGR